MDDAAEKPGQGLWGIIDHVRGQDECPALKNINFTMEV